MDIRGGRGVAVQQFSPPLITLKNMNYENKKFWLRDTIKQLKTEPVISTEDLAQALRDFLASEEVEELARELKNEGSNNQN